MHKRLMACRTNEMPVTRREMLTRCGMGMAGIGLADLLSEGGFLSSGAAQAESAASGLNPLAPRRPHFAGRAKHVIHLFMNGGPSHVDTFDPKPMLQKYAGKSMPMPQLKTERPTGAALPSPYQFRRYGQSGIEVSELFAQTAEHVDKMAIIRSMHADVPNHEPSLMLMNCGAARVVRPSVGSWITYGLGSDNQNLPGFIALCPNGYPIKGPQNWQCGFLPGVYQGTHIDVSKGDIAAGDVEKLIPNLHSPHADAKGQRDQLDLLAEMNRRHAEARADEAALEARLQSFELAYRMQDEAAEAFDLSREPQHVRERYGETVQAKQLLLARRLVERGVRYVQLWHGQGQPWDSHDDIEPNHRRLAGQCDQGIAALLHDLEERGLLDETLVVWGGEFGRTPAVELPKPGSNQGKINGRDHNHWGFTMWLAGGGIKGGTVYGATDETGFQAAENPVHVHDLHATILHLLGFDHTALTYRFAGRDFRLTDVHGRVIDDIVA